MEESYKQYLKGNVWARLSQSRKEIDGYKCYVCGSPDNLNVHHLRYPKHLGDESVENDLVTLCHPCHTMLHRIKRQVEINFPNYKTYTGSKLSHASNVVRYLRELIIVETWQRDIGAGGDLRTFDSGMKTVKSLIRLGNRMIYPDLKSELFRSRLCEEDAVRMIRTALIVQYYRNGKLVREIAEQFGMKENKVYETLKRHGFGPNAPIV